MYGTITVGQVEGLPTAHRPVSYDFGPGKRRGCWETPRLSEPEIPCPRIAGLGLGTAAISSVLEGPRGKKEIHDTWRF